MAKNSHAAGRNPRGMRRLLRFFLYTVLTAGILLVIAAVALRILYPADKLKNIAIEKIAAALQSDVSAGRVDFGLFSGLTLHDVDIVRRDNADSLTLPLREGHLDRLVLKYRLLALLRRRLDVHTITIEKPEAELLFYAMTSGAAEPTVISTDTSIARAQSSLPFSIHLRELRIRDVSCDLYFINDSSTIYLSLRDLTLVLTDLHVPRGGSESWQTLEGNISLSCNRAPVVYRQKKIEQTSPLVCRGLFQIDLSARARGLTEVNAALTITVEEGIVTLPEVVWSAEGEDENRTLPPLLIQLHAEGDIISGDYSVQHLVAAIGGDPLIEISGEVEKLARRPSIDAVINESILNVPALNDIFRKIMPAGQLAFTLPTVSSGQLSLAGSRIVGSFPSPDYPSDLAIRIKFACEDVAGQLATVAKLQNVALSTEALLTLNSGGISQGSIDGALSFDQIYYSLNDSMQIQADSGTLHIASELSPGLIPRTLDFDCYIEDVIGSHLEIALQATNIGGTYDYQGSGGIAISHLPLNYFSPQIKGSLDSRLDLQISTLEDIKLQLAASAESLAILREGEEESLPRLAIAAAIDAHIDTNFTEFGVDSFAFTMDKLLAVHGTGEITTGDDGRFTIVLHDASLKHGEVAQLLPDKVKDQLGEMQIDGETHLSGWLNGRIGDEAPTFTAGGTLLSQDISLEYPPATITLDNMDISSSFALDSASAQIELNTTIGSIIAPTYRAEPLSDITLQLRCCAPGYQRISLEEGIFTVPDLALNLSLQGVIATDAGNPVIDVNSHLSIQSEDTLQLYNQLAYRGSTNLAMKVRIEQNQALLDGLFELKEADIIYADEVTISGISSHIPFAQSYDIKNQRLLADSYQSLFANHGSDYLDIFSDFYTTTLPEMGWLSVERIAASGFFMQNFHARLLLGGGRIEIPSLFVNLYDGNFGGSASVNLGSGDLARANFTVAGHLSGINSALLTTRRGDSPERGIINSTFMFSGYGLDITKEVELEGYFFITDIGPKTADNLLRSLDPRGTDSGIRTTRFLINHGFKPKLMSFIIKHGYLYPRIDLSQPWYFPAKIKGGKVELSRIPIQLFIQLLAQSESEMQ